MNISPKLNKGEGLESLAGLRQDIDWLVSIRLSKPPPAKQSPAVFRPGMLLDI